jgi:predicted ATPase
MALIVRTVAASGYRSLRDIRFAVERLSVYVGANGVGKTNLYRALQLLHAAAAGTLAGELASEGGMESALWAGERRKQEPARISLAVGFALPNAREAAYAYSVAAGLSHSYEVDVGVPKVTSAAFALEPQIKEETLTFHGGRRPVALLERRGPMVMARDEEGKRADVDIELMASETALGSLEDPARFPDLALIRRTMLDWRFYHDFRTDGAAPLRQPCLAVTSPTLASDGANLAAVFATLAHIRQDTTELDAVIDDAFPGAGLVIPPPGRTASFGMSFPDYPKRVFEAGELSDGTLRYLALAGALLAYRLPAFVLLNEPETSLHADLLEPLARLIAGAARRTQIWLVTHSEALATALARHGAVKPRTVVRRDGTTLIEGLTISGEPRERHDDEE